MSRMQKRHLTIILLVALVGVYALMLARFYVESKQTPKVRIVPTVHYNHVAGAVSVPSFHSVSEVKTCASGVAVPLRKSSFERLYGGAKGSSIYVASSQKMHSIGGGGMTSAYRTDGTRPAKAAPTMRMTTFSTSPLLAMNSAYASIPSQQNLPARVMQRVSRPPFPLDPGEDGGYGPQFPEEPGEDPCLHCLDKDHDGICDVCGHSLIGCGCDDCRCPIGDVPIGAILLMVIGYGIAKKRSLLAFSRRASFVKSSVQV